MSIFSGARRDAELMRDAVVQAVAANDQLATSAAAAAAAYEKGALAVAPVLGPGGMPAMGPAPARASGGASSSPGGGSAGSGSGGLGGAAGYFDVFGNFIPYGAAAFDATGLPIFDPSAAPRVSGQSGGGGSSAEGGGITRRLFPRLTPAGGNVRGVPITPAGNNTGPIIPAGGGKAAVFDATNASLLSTVARGVAETNRILANLSRGDGGAQLFRERIAP